MMIFASCTGAWIKLLDKPSARTKEGVRLANSFIQALDVENTFPF